MKIFVLGKSGSGKSTFSKLLAKKLNYKYLDIDLIGHKIYENGSLMKKLYKLFGDEINNENGLFDRKKLGKVLFNEKDDSKKVKKFNNLTWKYMNKMIKKEITENIIIDWQLLPLTKYWKMKAFKVLITAKDENERIEKLIIRDNIKKEYAILRDSKGVNFDDYNFDLKLINDYTMENLNNNLETVIKNLKI